MAKAIAKSKRHSDVVKLEKPRNNIRNKKGEPKTLMIKFFNKDIELQYNAWSMADSDGRNKTTLLELINDIQLKPWATEGMGIQKY